MKISAIIITFNEEKNIERCILSLLGIVDEIIVVDSFSKDKTKEICLKHGVTFIEHTFEGHIQQKNWAKEQSTFDYVLSLDADEALNDILKKDILRIKAAEIEGAFTMNRLTNYCGKWIKHCGWYPDTKLRLWNKNKGEWVGDNPHDKFELFVKNGTISHLKGDLLHYSYYTKEDHYKQVNYFTSILAKAQYQKDKNSSLLVLVFSPIVKFLKDYFVNLGILDGKAGFTICRISAYATYLKYKKIRLLRKGIEIA